MLISPTVHYEGVIVSRHCVSDFLMRVEKTGSIGRCTGSGRLLKQMEGVTETIDIAMCAYDETTVKSS